MSSKINSNVYISTMLQQAVIEEPAYLAELIEVLKNSTGQEGGIIQPLKVDAINTPEQAANNLRALQNNKGEPVYMQRTTSKGRVCIMTKTIVKDKGHLFKKPAADIDIYIYRPVEDESETSFINFTQMIENKRKSKL